MVFIPPSLFEKSNPNPKPNPLGNGILLLCLAVAMFSFAYFVLNIEKISPKQQLINIEGELIDSIVDEIQLNKGKRYVTRLFIFNKADHKVKQIELDNRYNFPPHSNVKALVDPVKMCECFKTKEIAVNQKLIFDYSFSVESVRFPGIVMLLCALAVTLFGCAQLVKWRKDRKT